MSSRSSGGSFGSVFDASGMKRVYYILIPSILWHVRLTLALRIGASMLARGTALRRHIVLRSPRRLLNHGAIQRRRMSTMGSPIPSPSSSMASPLASVTSELDKLSPRFDVPAGSIEVLKSPSEFYETLKVRWKSLPSPAQR